MASFGGRLRVWVVAAFVFSATPLAALFSLDCCLAHRPDSETTAPEPTADADCPMHRQNDDSDSDCVLRSSCNGPLDVLAAFLSQNGAPAESYELALDLTIERAGRTSPLLLTVGHLPLESPPPRA